MDPPKQVASLLESFPPDILAYLVSYLPGEQLGRLLMTGATHVWQRLKFSNVVKSITLGEDFLVFKSVPQFLNDFPSLEELIIYSSHAAWSSKLGLKIDAIPSGVRKLELNGEWSDWDQTCDLLFGGYGDAILKLNQHLPHLQVLDLSCLRFESYSWLTHSPHTLTYLSIDRWYGQVELPTSLLHLKVGIITLDEFSKFPPSLESFQVRTELVGADLAIPLLPPSCHNLNLGHRAVNSDGSDISQTFLEQLPKSLLSFVLPWSILQQNEQLTALLPSTLTELKIYATLPISAWCLLPQQLTKLSMACKHLSTTVVSTTLDENGAHYEVDTIPFQTLPRSITILNLFEYQGDQCFCGPPATSDSFFPPQLTHLHIPRVQLAPEVAKLLPPSLTYLEIGNFCERVCQHLPTGLKTLISSRTLVSPNLVKYLPKSLTFLDFSIPNASMIWFQGCTGKAALSISSLPEYSIHEKCLSKGFDWDDASSLPHTLTYFHLDQARELGDSFLSRQKLPNLLELDLGSSNSFTDLSIPYLSSHLTSLNLKSSSKVSGKSFQFLPRCLTYLNLSSSQSIFDSDIQHLPRTLKYAFLQNAKHLTDACISDLPPHLENLSLGHNFEITPSSFPNFPYPFRSSQRSSVVDLANWFGHQGEVHMKKAKQS